jgi:hypothetical protein
VDPVRQAIASKLLADPAVTGKLGAANAVYHRRAPVNATYPLIIMNRQSGTDEDYAFDGRGLVRDVWLVKAVDRSFLSGAAEDIAAAIDRSLHFADLTITGYNVGPITRRSRVDYGEPDGAEQYVHVGSLFRLDLQPA